MRRLTASELKETLLLVGKFLDTPSAAKMLQEAGLKVCHEELVKVSIEAGGK